VIIPTYLRPALVTRAVRSALDQTLERIEIIVIDDGRDEATRSALRGISEERVRIHEPTHRLGNADARNEGVRLARAHWVAFLDDDDEWMSEKLEKQLAAADQSDCVYPIVACHMIARDEISDVVWPRRLPAVGEPLSEYFYCRKTPFTGEGMVINSAILTARELLLKVRFRSHLERHVDPDWLLRAIREPGAELEFVREAEPLLVWHIERDRRRITTQPDWEASLAWCSRNRDLFTSRGYAAFVLHVVSSSAAAQRLPRAFFRLLREAFARGRPSLLDVASHCGNFALPIRLQRKIAHGFARISFRGQRRAPR